MILASASSLLGSIWFALLLGALGVGVGVWLAKSKKI
jgi:hypothetical protein